MKVAIVHDWLVNFGGAESLVLKLHRIFPEAPIYTCVYDKKKMGKYFEGIEIKTSFIQKMPFGVSKYRYYLSLMPMAFEQFDFSEYDLVISSSTCCAKGINVNADTLHICYCNTPMRYAWDMYNKYNQGMFLKRALIASQIHKLRQWDYISSNRVDYFIANSNNVANRIKKHYRRESEVIYPGINNDFYEIPILEKKEDFYLLVTRFVEYKRADIIIRTFNKIGLPLVIVGDGPQRKRLQKMANKNIEFKGKVSNDSLKELYQNCKAFVFVAEEDFGMVMVEAQAAGKPVIAYKKGGASEIVKDGETGILFNEQKETSLEEAINKLEKMKERFNPYVIRENAKRFSEDVFLKRIKEFTESKYMDK